ncbi:hypothetical protein [Pseudomonas syringae group genomosp. 3]|uniref:hypothetical protein n=1 Tax=Pseudomonas syringae group genomosp. 3 TaxID=251701 RepID=UPI0011C3F08E|nr:hypothetical protein [Pseudomonas syringae group genomosp. 3]
MVDFRLLPAGRGSEHVREDDVLGAAFSATILALSRTSSLPRPEAGIKSGLGLVYNAERAASAPHEHTNTPMIDNK